MRITLAVAGFSRDQIEVTVEENQLAIRGRQQEDKTREYLHRGIAARQFQRSFLLAEGMQVLSADLAQGLLSIDLVRPQPERVVRKDTDIGARLKDARRRRVDRTAGKEQSDENRNRQDQAGPRT